MPIQIINPAYPLSEEWVDDRGLRVVGVHFKNKEHCEDHGCALHNPSNHHMRDWPLYWHQGAKCFVRICEHGEAHPDPDEVAYRRRTGERLDTYFHVCCEEKCCDA